MDYNELKQISAKVEDRQGWDFSKMEDEREPVPWDYMTVVQNYLRQTDCVLDVGTGGGERFVELARFFAKGVGIDADPSMIKAANSNLPALIKHKVVFKEMKETSLQFEDKTFDLVINRQAPFTPDEVLRVLKKDGYFITQQVGKANMHNIIAEFGWDFLSLPQAKTPKIMAKAFAERGCRVVAQGEYDVRYFVKNIESLIFWLRAVMYESATGFPESFNLEKHWKVIDRIITNYQTFRGIETNEHRTLLIVQKLEA